MIVGDGVDARRLTTYTAAGATAYTAAGSARMANRPDLRCRFSFPAVLPMPVDDHSPPAIDSRSQAEPPPAAEPPPRVVPATAADWQPAAATFMPRYSFRTLMLVMSLLAVVALLFRQAWAGAAWAQGIGFVLLFVVGCGAMFVGLFLLAWLPATIGRDRLAETVQGSPFAGDRLPPQRVPPGQPPG